MKKAIRKYSNNDKLLAFHTSLSSKPIGHSNATTSKKENASKTTNQDEIEAAADSAASDHYFPIGFNGGEHDDTGKSYPVGTADGNTMHSAATDVFYLKGAPIEARRCKKFYEVSLPLVSVGKLCVHGMTVMFNKAGVYVFKDGDMILEGRRDPLRNLYLLPVSAGNVAPISRVSRATENLTHEMAANAYELRAVPALISYLHGCAGYIPKETWIAGIDAGYYVTWPGLTSTRVRKHLQKSEHTVMGHMKRIRQGIRSTTKPKKTLRSKQHRVGIYVIDTEDLKKELKNQIGQDLCGRYPVTSTTGNKYIYIMYDTDSNYIKPMAMSSRETDEIIRCYSESYAQLQQAGFTAQLLRLDNEVSKKLISKIEDDKLDYQLAAPGDHRLNFTERHGIQNFKNHLISMMSGTDPSFPRNCWDLLLHQAEITVNLARPSNITPGVSAYTMINGAFDFNKTPLAPAGCKTIVHDGTDERKSWAQHGSRGYYIGPALKHYRCYRNTMLESKAVRVSNTVEFFPVACQDPILSDGERISMLLADLISIVSKPTRTIASIRYGTELNDALRTMQQLMCKNKLGEQQIEGITIEESIVPSNLAPLRVTRSKTATTRKVSMLGTKVRRQFKSGWQNGTVITYDAINEYYIVKYNGGEREELDTHELAVLSKVYQSHLLPSKAKLSLSATNQYERRAEPTSHKKNINSKTTIKKLFIPAKPGPNFLLKRSYDNNIFYIPTKASPNPMKRDYYKKQASILLQHKLAQLQQQANSTESAFAASGRIWDEELNKMASYRDLIKHHNKEIQERWMISGENEFGRLFQGFKPNNIEGLGVLNWIQRGAVPHHKKVTYPRYTVAERPEKEESDRTRITCGGDQLDYFGDVTTHTASMETIKIHWNSVLSTSNAKYCTGDISNMYLMSTLPEAEYVRFRYDLIPPRIIKHYQLDLLVNDGYVYARINKAWYGLKQGGKIAHDDLVEHLQKHGYVRAGYTDGLFKHTTRDISFTLVVDDFGIKYVKQEDVDHLVSIMRQKYTFKVDFDAKQYIGIHLDWNYMRRELICSMKNYVKQALMELKHAAKTRQQHAPSKLDRPEYVAKVQYAKVDESTELEEPQIKYLQRVVGKFLYYARAIDTTMLHAINDIGSAVTKGTVATQQAVQHFMDYAHSNPDGEIIFRASDMQLQADSDASYLVAPKACSRAGGFHWLGSNDGTLFNGPIYVLAKIIKHVMGSAMEAEIRAMYMNAQKLVEYRQTLKDMGHPQKATLIRTDNKTACGILTGTMKQKASKFIDMNFHWLGDRTVKQKQFKLEWAPGPTNIGDYPTKHHFSKHHQNVRPIYLYVKGRSPSTLEGCNRILSPMSHTKSDRQQDSKADGQPITDQRLSQSTGKSTRIDIARRVVNRVII